MLSTHLQLRSFGWPCSQLVFADINLVASCEMLFIYMESSSKQFLMETQLVLVSIHTIYLFVCCSPWWSKLFLRGLILLYWTDWICIRKLLYIICLLALKWRHLCASYLWPLALNKQSFHRNIALYNIC